MNEKILVVDDEQEIGELVGLYLKNEGYTVFSCTLGAEALACVEREELSLAILDVMLPDMTGFDLCRRIRETHMFPPKFFQNYPLGLKSSKKGVLFWKSGKIGLAFFAGV